jgi:predicted RNase H-like nuclease (RuvC/YqgF family)
MDSRAKDIRDALLRMLLRLLPILPGVEIYDLIRATSRSQGDVDKQVEEAMEALSRSSTLIESLSKTLAARERKVKELKAEYDRVSELASLTKSQGEAVARSLELVLGRDKRRERFVGFIINIAAGLILFVVGVFAADWVKSVPEYFFSNAAQIVHS